MIYNEFGKPIEETASDAKMPVGMNVFPDASDRYETDASRSLTPSKIDTILTAALQGDICEQSKLALDIEEKNHDIGQSMETRKNAVLGIPWSVEPGDDTPAAKKAAEEFKKALDSAGGMNGKDTFDELRSDMLTAIIAGFSVSEIIWKAGGGIAGFNYIEQRHFTFREHILKLVTTAEPNGIELTPRKFIVNRYRRRGSNIARGGLIRTLAWLHCFQNLNFKDLLSFIERYGMPFIVVKVDQNSWDNERNILKNLVRNFGPNGGGVFTKAVEFELLQAANNSGDVYFKLLEYCGAAITKLILGQTASSGDSSGLSKGDSQSKVRQDILEADCSILDTTINSQLAEPWNTFNSPAGTAAPKVKHHCKPPEDVKSLADTVKIFYDAGYDTDPDEMTAKAGFKLTRRVAAPVAPVIPQQNIALSAENPVSGKGQEASAGIEKWADPLIKRINDALESDGGINKLSGLSFEDFNGAILEDFLGSSAVTAAADGKMEEAEKIKRKLPTADSTSSPQASDSNRQGN